MPRITSMSWPFKTIMLVGKSRSANVTGTWKDISLVNIYLSPKRMDNKPSLDSVQRMQCFYTNFLLMNVCEAPESKRITTG
jgi:hypothetical protein